MKECRVTSDNNSYCCNINLLGVVAVLQVVHTATVRNVGFVGLKRICKNPAVFSKVRRCACVLISLLLALDMQFIKNVYSNVALSVLFAI